MSTLKITPVKKNPSIKPAVVADRSPQYTLFKERNMDDPKVIDDIIRAINILDKDSHEEIYRTIRKFKPDTFFAANNLDTRFNIYGLNEAARRELDHTIQLCMENMKRKHVLEEASDEHLSDLERLDSRLDIKPLTDFETEDARPVNPSETDKIREMLQMNL